MQSISIRMYYKALPFLGALLILSAASAIAGSLTPPGAPAPTMKSLDEVEARIPIRPEDIPTVINEPGSYYLTDNIVQAGAGNAITVEASNVTIDLNGFTMQGPGRDFAGVGSAISVEETSYTIVRNGNITEWPNSGVFLEGFKSLAENLDVSLCGTGIAFKSGSVRNCQVEYCRLTGIATVPFSKGEGVIENCISNHNLGQGIDISGSHCIVRNNQCAENGGSGIVVTGPGHRVEGNNVSNNAALGIQALGRSLVIKNSAMNNAGDFSSFQGRLGPIIDMTGGGTITSENPWANIRY